MTEEYAKMLRLLGLARRAGRLLWGAEACEQALRKGKLHFLLIAAEAGQSTRQRFTGLCERHGIACDSQVSAADLEAVCGRSPIVLVAVSDTAFAAELIRLSQIRAAKAEQPDPAPKNERIE